MKNLVVSTVKLPFIVNFYLYFQKNHLFKTLLLNGLSVGCDVSSVFIMFSYLLDRILEAHVNHLIIA